MRLEEREWRTSDGEWQQKGSDRHFKDKTHRTLDSLRNLLTGILKGVIQSQATGPNFPGQPRAPHPYRHSNTWYNPAVLLSKCFPMCSGITPMEEEGNCLEGTWPWFGGWEKANPLTKNQVVWVFGCPFSDVPIFPSSKALWPGARFVIQHLFLNSAGST